MNRSINSLKTALVGIPFAFLAAGNAKAATINFTSSEGYTNNVLNLQPGSSGTWKTSSTSTYFQVDTTNGGSVSVATSVNSPIAGYFEPVNFSTSGPITTSMDFQFTQSIATIPSGSTKAFGLVYTTSQAAGVIATTAATLGRQNGTDFYRFATFNANTVNIAGSLLGINSAGSDSFSDVIRLTLTLTYSSGTWNGVANLLNVTTGTSLATSTQNNLTIGSTTLYSAMQIGDGMTTSGLSSLSVLSYTTPVPEPGTTALVGLGFGALLLFRRRTAQALR